MCGLVAVLSKNTYGLWMADVNIFKSALYADALRGFDSTGIFMVDIDANAYLLKTKQTPLSLMCLKDFKTLEEYSKRRGMVLVGHNRKATQGTISDENAHPFLEGNTILVHNGTLVQHKKLKDTEVDSHAICHIIDEKGYKEALKEIDGAFALIWYDAKEKKVRFCRNNKRPLFLLESKKNYLLASEGDMMKWLSEREGYQDDHKIISCTEIETKTVYSYDIKTQKIEKEVVKYYEDVSSNNNQGFFHHTSSANSAAGIKNYKKDFFNGLEAGEYVYFYPLENVDTTKKKRNSWLTGLTDDNDQVRVLMSIQKAEKFLKEYSYAKVKISSLSKHNDTIIIIGSDKTLHGLPDKQETETEDEKEVFLTDIENKSIPLKEFKKDKVFCSSCGTEITEAEVQYSNMHPSGKTGTCYDCYNTQISYC